MKISLRNKISSEYKYELSKCSVGSDKMNIYGSMQEKRNKLCSYNYNQDMQPQIDEV